jgi:acetyl-CoA C-acetyltransferase
MLTGPAPAARKALAKAGLKVKDIDLWEINEAFASVAMRFMKDMGISTTSSTSTAAPSPWATRWAPPAAMIMQIALDELERRGLKRALCTLCVGGGMGIATIIERV